MPRGTVLEDVLDHVTFLRFEAVPISQENAKSPLAFTRTIGSVLQITELGKGRAG